MTLRRTFRFAALCAPLLVFALVVTLPDYSARLSLLLHGRPFARIVAKENLDIFRYVSEDSFACRAIVFSQERAVGWICLPSTGGFASYVPFSEQTSLIDTPDPDPWFHVLLIISWALRWWLLPVQVALLLFWVYLRQRRLSSAPSALIV